MRKLFLAFLCLAGSADAAIVIHESDAHYVLISADWEYNDEANVCDYYFPYKQRMTIDGSPSAMVPTEFIYPAGRFDLYLSGDLCGGYHLYGVGDCAC